MMGWKTVIAMVGLSLVFAGPGYADLTWPDSYSAAPSRSASDPPWVVERFPSPWNKTAGGGISDLFQTWDESLPEHLVETEGAAATGRRHVLADERGSLTFCLYGLLGLGFLKSVPCGRRLPSWAITACCHNGRFLEIGPYLAASSDDLCIGSVCAAPPHGGAKPLPAFYRLGVIASLWRRSQFIPTIRIPRGPPPSCSRGRF